MKKSEIHGKINRRPFLNTSALAGAALTSVALCNGKQKGNPNEMPP
jgi:nitrous oxide reductase